MLDILEKANRPVGAYEIAERAEGVGASLVPNQVYRTVARLIHQRVVRRIETLNAYMPARSPADLCLVCAQCHAIELIAFPSLHELLAAAIADTGFRPSIPVLEALGRCPRCQAAGALSRCRQGRNVQ